MKRLSEQTLYEILEVPADAAAPEIEAAWTRARDLYGPGSLATYSLMPAEEAKLLSERIAEAGRVLLDPEARARYDAGIAPATVVVDVVVEAELRAVATGTGTVAPAPARPRIVPPIIPALPATPPPLPLPGEGHREAGEQRAAEPAESAPPPVLPAAEPMKVPETAAVVPPPLPAAAPPAPAPILLQREVPVAPAPRELPVPDGAIWTGDALRKVRESRGLTVRELCDRTKVTRYHLENVEADRFTLLPAPVYLRGLLMAVARELRLDGQKVARSYLARMAEAAGNRPR